MPSMHTILVVDDSPVDRRLVAGLLRNDPMLTVETAENGLDAIRRLRESPFDLVVTDMQMPALDGLGLVRQIRLDQPHVPVILITAHGSESLAIEALQHGAASYVPKSQLTEMLEDSVAQVLALTGADRNYERLSACQTRAEFTFMLENEIAVVEPLVDFVQQIVLAMKLCDVTGKYRLGMALQQAVSNAIIHGNLQIPINHIDEAREEAMGQTAGGLLDRRRAEPPFSDRRVMVDVRITPEQAVFVIRDDGNGFDIAPFHDTRTAELKGGRGLRLMHLFMDEVKYNARGNEVTMIKRREEHATPILENAVAAAQ